MARAKRITQVIVIVTTVVWLLWDLLVYLKIGGPATISTVIGEWQAVNLFVGLLIACGIGILAGHLLQSTPSNDPFLLIRWIVFGCGLVVGFLITPR